MKDFKDEKLYLIHLIFQAMNKRQSENPPENLKWKCCITAYYHKVSNIIYYSLKDVKINIIYQKIYGKRYAVIIKRYCKGSNAACHDRNAFGGI